MKFQLPAAVSAAAALALAATPAAAMFNIEGAAFITSATNSNGFDNIASPWFTDPGGYTQDGINVRYVGANWAVFTNGANSSRFWSIDGFNGYTEIKLANAGTFNKIQFAIGSNAWLPNFQYEALNAGAVVSSGVITAFLSSSPRIMGFDGATFDTIRLQSTDSGTEFSPAKSDNIILDDIKIAGTSNGGAVPEPATWAMMILGFGMAGASMRRLRTSIA